jgi:large repetitive protein
VLGYDITTQIRQPLALTVNSGDDQVDKAPGDGVCATLAGTCTLRAAIQEANAFPTSDMITVPPGMFLIRLAGLNENAAAKGDLDITDPTVIR